MMTGELFGVSPSKETVTETYCSFHTSTLTEPRRFSIRNALLAGKSARTSCARLMEKGSRRRVKSSKQEGRKLLCG
jgi:hypothetical protein